MWRLNGGCCRNVDNAERLLYGNRVSKAWGAARSLEALLSLSRLYVSMLQQMGLEVVRFGSITGRLPGLESQG